QRKLHVQVMDGEDDVAIHRMTSLLDVVLGVGRIRKGVADDVEGYRDDREDQHRQKQLVVQARLIDDDLPGLDEVAERRHFQRHAETDVGDKDLVADRGGDGQRHPQRQDADKVGQQVFDHDPPGRGAQAPGSKVIIPVADNQHLVAHKPGGLQPGGQAHRKDHRADAGAQDVGDDDDDERLGDVVKDVVDFGEQE